MAGLSTADLDKTLVDLQRKLGRYRININEFSECHVQPRSIQRYLQKSVSESINIDKELNHQMTTRGLKAIAKVQQIAITTLIYENSTKLLSSGKHLENAALIPDVLADLMDRSDIISALTRQIDERQMKLTKNTKQCITNTLQLKETGTGRILSESAFCACEVYLHELLDIYTETERSVTQQIYDAMEHWKQQANPCNAAALVLKLNLVLDAVFTAELQFIKKCFFEKNEKDIALVTICSEFKRMWSCKMRNTIQMFTKKMQKLQKTNK